MSGAIKVLVAAAFTILTLAGAADAAGLNKKFLLIASVSKIDMVALNPQPLPPKEGATSRLDMVGLNPQPLPPKSPKIFLGH